MSPDSDIKELTVLICFSPLCNDVHLKYDRLETHKRDILKSLPRQTPAISSIVPSIAFDLWSVAYRDDVWFTLRSAMVLLMTSVILFPSLRISLLLSLPRFFFLPQADYIPRLNLNASYISYLRNYMHFSSLWV